MATWSCTWLTVTKTIFSKRIDMLAIWMTGPLQRIRYRIDHETGKNALITTDTRHSANAVNVRKIGIVALKWTVVRAAGNTTPISGATPIEAGEHMDPELAPTVPLDQTRNIYDAEHAQPCNDSHG